MGYISNIYGLVNKTKRGNVSSIQMSFIHELLALFEGRILVRKENLMTNGTKFKIGDKIICVKTPLGPVKPNIRKGDKAVLTKNPTVNPNSSITAQAYFYVKGSTRKYCYWEEDNECYAKEEANLEETIERECKVLN